MRALVTGGRGFVGKWLCEHLRDQGDEVIFIDHEIDVTDAGAIGRAIGDASPDAVYHLAAISHVGRSWQEPARVLEVNALGTLNVLEAARQCPEPPVVLLTSSAEVYGEVSEAELPIKESAELRPATPYAASKVAAEYLGVQAHLGHGLQVLRVRPFNHVGPGQSDQFVVAALAARILDAHGSGKAVVRVGNLAARRDLTDVRDVVRAYRLLVLHGTPGEVYNVCSGRDVSISEVANRLAEMAGGCVSLEVDPELVRPVDLPVLRGDPERLESATGWKPEIDLDKTLADVLAYWREQRKIT